MKPGEIYLAKFPYGDVAAMKLRPMLLLTGPIGSVPELIGAYISSVIPSPRLPSDLVLDPSQPEHATTNLKTISVVRLHKLATLHKTSIVRYLGVISTKTKTEIDDKLRLLFSL